MIAAQTASSRATFGNVKGLKPVAKASRPSARKVVSMAAVSADVPDMAKRSTMNLLLLGAIGLPVTALAAPYALFFVPKSSGGSTGGQAALDALGNTIRATEYLKTHLAGSRELAQGLKGDATYLIVNNESNIENYGLNAVCTHLGCVVPWNNNENKFMCPCHGSQYNFQGKVVRGPAPLSLALAHVDIVDDVVTFSPWPETDFRTGLEPWWS